MNNQKHIAIDARTIATSSGTYVLNLLKYLETVDSTNTYSVLVRPAQKDYWQPQNPNFRIIEAPFADFSFAEQLGLKKLLDSLKPDLVHFCFPQFPILYRGDFVVTIHDLTMLTHGFSDPRKFKLKDAVRYLKQPVFNQVIRLAAMRSKAVITPTDYVKGAVINRFGLSPDKVFRTYESADKLSYDTPVPIDELVDQEYLIYVSNGVEYKNVKGLILAHQELLNTDPDIKLALVGRLNKDQIAAKKWVDENNFVNVVFTGFISNEQLAWAYEHAEVYVFPSLSEGFGLPGLEAMHFGVPVASSDATCLPEVYKDAAIYFNPLSTESMVSAIAELLEDKSVRERYIKRGRELLGEYSWQTMAIETLHIYEGVLSND